MNTDHNRETARQTALFETSRELLARERPAAVAETAVEAAREVLDLPLTGIYLADAAGDVLRPAAVSDAAADVIGDDPPEAGDSLAWQVFETGELRSRDDSRRADGAATDDAVRTELAVPLGDHGVFLAASTAPGVFDDRTVSLVTFLAGTVETALDHCDRKRQLRDQQDRLEAFIGTLSHDLRSPLAVARSGVEVARRTDSDDSLDRVDRAHDRIQTLLDDLLTLAREGEALEETDLDSVTLSRVATDAWRATETTDVEAAFDADETVLASRSRLQQLLENLFRNGVEHGRTAPPEATTADPAVTIRVGLLADGFYVEDDGPGIDAADREAVFEAGYSTRDGGTGLGLRIVHTVADAHGWDVTVTEAAGGGARFEITGVERAPAGPVPTEPDHTGEHS